MIVMLSHEKYNFAFNFASARKFFLLLFNDTLKSHSNSIICKTFPDYSPP